MIWQLVKREIAWREVYGYVGVVAAMSLFLPQFAGPIFVFVVAMTWLRSLPAERASLFQAGLPIAAADLFLARALAFLTLVWLPATAGALALVVRKEGDAGMMLLAAAGLSVLVLAPLSHRVRELSGSQWAPAISMTLVSAAAWPASHYLPRDVLAALCGVICAVVFVTSWRRLPMSFEVVEARRHGTTLPAAPRDDAMPPGVEGRSILLHAWPVARCVLPLRSLGFLPLVVMQGLTGQSVYSTSMALFPILTALGRIAWLRSLPISRGALLTATVAPWSLVVALNLLAGGLLLPARNQIQYDYVADKLGSIRPPLEYWSIAPQDKAPVIESPWHETWQPPVEHVAGTAIYNPYSMGAANSRQFLEWQYRRATLAIYGQEIPFNDYHPTRLRPLQQEPRFVTLNIAAGQCWVLFMLNVVLLSMHWRVQRVHSRAAYFAAFLLFVPMMSPLILEVFIKHPGNSLGPALLNAALLRILAILPGGVVPPVLASIVPPGILWWSALRLFKGVEPQPVDPTVRT